MLQPMEPHLPGQHKPFSNSTESRGNAPFSETTALGVPKAAKAYVTVAVRGGGAVIHHTFICFLSEFIGPGRA